MAGEQFQQVLTGAGVTSLLAQTGAANLLTSGESTVPRSITFSAAATTLSNQVFRLTFFTAVKTEPITQVRIPSGSTAAGATPTLCRVGIYSVDSAGAGTLINSIANDTALWATQNTDYLRSLTATFNKVAGQRYAFAWLCVTGATAPAVPGAQVLAAGAPGSNAAARAPRLSGALTAQADLPNGFTDAGLTATGGLIYAELVP